MDSLSVRCYALGMAKPESKSLFEMQPEAAHEARLDAEAEADCAAGRIGTRMSVSAHG